MYVSENGYNKWDEFNIIHKGRNYGWISCEGNYLYNSTTTLCTNPAFVNPIAQFGTPLPAVTGCTYYTSSLMPEFTNHILLGDNDNGRLYDLTMGNSPAYDIVTSNVIFADISTGGITTVRQGPEGCIYAMEGGYTTNGKIYKICPVGMGLSSNGKSGNEIGQNYPNPTTGNTQIDFVVAEESDVNIELYDVTGRKVKSVFAGSAAQGKHTVELNGLDKFAEGSYFYKIEVKQNKKVVFTETKRLMLVK
jgi:hypothetical protein